MMHAIYAGEEAVAKFASMQDAQRCMPILAKTNPKLRLCPALTNSEYCKERRKKAKRAGIRIQCNAEEAEEGLSKCVGCRQANKAKR